MLGIGLAFLAAAAAVVVGVLSNWIKPPEKMTARVVIALLVAAAVVAFIIDQVAAKVDSDKKSSENSNANSQSAQPAASNTHSSQTTTDSTAPFSTRPTETPSNRPTDTAPTTTPKKPSKEFLSGMRAINSNSVNSPRIVQIDSTTYTDSLTIGCEYPGGTTATYPVAGYSKLTSKVGVDPNTDSAAATQGLRCKVQVFNEKKEQLGEDLVVSIGNSGSLDLNLNGAAQVTFKCTLLDGLKGYPSAYYPLAFGTPTITE